jgi:hypothetical protein
MKKILIILLILIAGCAKQPVYKASRAPSLTLQDINIGTVANDHTGDPLRTMGTKINTNNTALRNFAATLLTATEINALLAAKAALASPQFTGVPRISTDTIAVTADIDSLAGLVIADSLQTLRDSADVASDYYVEKVDSNSYGGGYITRPYLESRLGSGGSSTGFSYYSKEFQVGDTGFPASGDSIITSADWAGRDVKVYRDGLLQRRRLTADGTEGARINNTTGAVTVHPAFSSSEQIVIEATDPTARYEAVITGTESSLRTGLVAGWQLDESAGNTANDILGVYHGTNTGVTVNATGKFGKAFQYAGAGYTNMGTTSPLRFQTHTISLWVNTSGTSISGLVSNWVWYSGQYYGYDIVMLANGTLQYRLKFNDATDLTLTSSAINNGAWHNIIATFDGTTAYLYVDNVQADTDGAAAKTIQYHANCAFHLGDDNETDYPLTGYIDGVYLWNRVVTSGERATIQTKPYPFE